MFGIESMWNPVGVRFFPIPTQCRAAHAGSPITHMTGTPTGFHKMRPQSNTINNSTSIHLPSQMLVYFRDATLAFTPTALDPKAQCRAAHAGLPIARTTEPQRGSTNNPKCHSHTYKSISTSYSRPRIVEHSYATKPFANDSIHIL